ncbi:hypothetical protein J6590_063559 [Homalodisca vitripennis]|nr:hypothetical protein J6590_063559 [Homalodisca vitripennis]
MEYQRARQIADDLLFDLLYSTSTVSPCTKEKLEHQDSSLYELSITSRTGRQIIVRAENSTSLRT